MVNDVLPPGFPVEVTVRTGSNETKTMRARATGVPGLVANLAPEEAVEEWGVTHQRSGLSLGFWTPDPELAIRFAAAVADLVDWTASGGEIREEVGRAGAAVKQIGADLGLRYYPDPAAEYGDVLGDV